MKTFRFTDFDVYNKSKVLYREISLVSVRITNYSIKDQLLRASLSVVLNIAEGSAKKSDKEFARYLEISIGSVNEVAACLDILKDNKIIDIEKCLILMSDCESVAKQLGGFIKKLNNKQVED